MPFKDKEKRYAASENWRVRRVRSDPTYERKRNLYRKYGMRLGEFEIILKAQGGVCAICGLPPVEGKNLVVDHCHKRGKVRGLLCDACNRGLGCFRDVIASLYAAIRYLEVSSIA